MFPGFRKAQRAVQGGETGEGIECLARFFGRMKLKQKSTQVGHMLLRGSRVALHPA